MLEVGYRALLPTYLTKPVNSGTVKFSEGHGHSINCSGSGMLLLLPEKVDQRQVFGVHVRSEAKATHITKVGEVCWTRPIPVNACVSLYLVGFRLLFEVPGLG